MTKITIEDLHQYLVDHKDEIDYVVLQWTWNPNYAVISTNNVGVVNGESNWPLFAVFDFNRIDEEYSFAGTVEEAIEYAKNYSQWDSRDFDLEDGILTAEYDDYNPDAMEYPAHEDGLTDISVTDISYFGLYYYKNGKIHSYDGPVARRKRNEDDD